MTRGSKAMEAARDVVERQDTQILTPSRLHPRLLHPKGHLRVLVAQQDVRDTRRGVAGGVEVLAAIAQIRVLLTFQTLPTFCKGKEVTQHLSL